MQTVPLDFLGDLRRTHTCGQLRAAHAGSRALLMGWVHRRRDLGGVIFIHLRDREGVSQVVFHEDVEPAVHARAEQIRPEFVVAVEGRVEKRTAETINANLDTGEVEIVAEKIWILNESRTPPFPMEGTGDVAQDVRLKYPYVDLDRQPEFPQIDLEMSFPQQERIYEVIEPMLQQVAKAAGFDVPIPFPRLTYAEAMRSYGSDKPDRRLPPMHPVDDLFKEANLAAA